MQPCWWQSERREFGIKQVGKGETSVKDFYANQAIRKLSYCRFVIFNDGRNLTENSTKLNGFSNEYFGFDKRLKQGGNTCHLKGCLTSRLSILANAKLMRPNTAKTALLCGRIARIWLCEGIRWWPHHVTGAAWVHLALSHFFSTFLHFRSSDC